MIEDEQAAPQVAGPGDDPVPPPPQKLTAAEYNEQLRKASTPKTDAQHPVRGLWDQIVHGTDDEQGTWKRASELARSVGRGIAGAPIEITNAIGEGAAAFDRSTGLGEKMQPGFNKAYDENGAADLASPITAGARGFVDKTLGKRSDDPLASFAESAAQFATAFEATGGLKIAQGFKALKTLKGVAGVVSTVARGAAVDASAFNPYEAQLAELAAKAPPGVVNTLGQLLSVKGDDGPIVARLKRGAAGAISGAALETVIAGARMLRGVKAAADPAATSVEKAAAHTQVEESAQTLQDIAQGDHVPDGAHVMVKDTGDGFVIDKAPDSPILNGVKGEGEALQSPVFPSRAEAETQAATINGAVDARLNVGKMDEGAAENLVQSASDPVAYAQRVQDPELNISHHNTPDQDMALVKDLSERLSAHIRDNVARDGKDTVLDAMQQAQGAVQQIPEDAAHPVMQGLLKGDTSNQSVVSLMADMVLRDKGKKIMGLWDAVDARPHDPVAMDELVQGLNNYFELRHTMYETTAEQGRSLRYKQERANVPDAVYKEAGSADEVPPAGRPADGEAAAADGEAPQPKAYKPKTADELPKIAGRNTRDASPAAVDAANAKEVGRMFKMSDGAPVDMNAAIHATRIIQETGNARAAFEWFVNWGLLSSPKTWATVALSGTNMSMFEPFTTMLAGVRTGNMALTREGADIMWGNFKYVADNLQSAAAAFREGRPITNPLPQHVVITGKLGNVVRAPSNVLTGLHEFFTVTNYRSWVRAQSLRAGRADGLAGDALQVRVDGDLKAAFDSQTGIATIPDGLKYAQQATFTAPLKDGSFGKGFQDFTNNHLEAKFIAPFVKISANIFDFAWKNTPVLNRFNSSARQILDAGGEAADVLRARTAIIGSVYAAGMYGAIQGNITGAGPLDPELRKLWLANHQPYSVKVGDEWVSYRRVEPFATALGLMADLHTAAVESSEKTPDAEGLAYATVAALGANFTSKTYLQSLTDFFGAFGAGNQNKVKGYLQKTVSGFVIPNGASSFNPDDTMREAQTMAEAIKARTPGFSKDLDPRFTIFGEPMLKDPNFIRRAMAPTAVRSAAGGVEDQLLELGRGFAAFPQKLLGGKIDLTDRESYDNGTGTSPWARFNAILAHPKYGPNFRDDMTKMMQSDEWKTASGTVEGVALGGKRSILAANLKTKHEDEAFAQLRHEYPKLDSAWKDAQREKGAAITGGQSGVEDFLARRKAASGS